MLRLRPSTKKRTKAPTTAKGMVRDDGEGMEQRLELRGQHHVDQHDGEDQREAQVGNGVAAERLFTGHGSADLRWKIDLHQRVLDVGHHVVEGSPLLQLGRHLADARLVAAVNLPRRPRGLNACDLVQTDAAAGGFKGQSGQLLDRDIGQGDTDVLQLPLVLPSVRHPCPAGSPGAETRSGPPAGSACRP